MPARPHAHPLLAGPPPPRRRARLAWPWRVRARAVAEATRGLATMLAAHVPLAHALELAASGAASGPLPAALQDVAQRVRRGQGMADALAAHPAAFGRLYVALTRAGEASGALTDVLLRLADHLEKQDALRRRIRLALVYPAAVLAVAAGAAAFLLVTVVPTFADLFADFGAELPAATRVVVRLGEALARWWPLGVLASAGAVAGAWRLRRHDRLRRHLDRWLLRVPLVGTLLLRGAAARWCRTLATLLDGGLPLADALPVAAGAAGNRHVETALAPLSPAVRCGRPLHAALRTAAVLPPLVHRLVAVGEETAAVAGMLGHAADYFEQEVDALVETMTALLEPALIVVVGLLLGALLAALYLPVFSLLDVMG